MCSQGSQWEARDLKGLDQSLAGFAFMKARSDAMKRAIIGANELRGFDRGVTGLLGKQLGVGGKVAVDRGREDRR